MKKLALVFVLLSTLAAWADVTTQSYSVTFSCTGSTGPYSFTFPVSAAGALTVTKDGTLVGSSAYTIVPVNNNYENGGAVTLNTACVIGSTLVLARVTPLTQATVFTDNMPTPMKTFERSLDKLTEIAQEQAGDISSLATWSCPLGSAASGMADFLPQCVTSFSNILAPLPSLAGTYLYFDGVAYAWKAPPYIDIRSIATYSSDMGAAINTALTQFGPAPACGPIVLPQGSYNVSTTISFSNRKGCRLVGAGRGVEGNPGTKLTWTGAANGTMFEILGAVRGGEFAHFQLDGNNSASFCFDARGASGQTSDQNSVHDIFIWNCTGAGAIPLHVGSAAFVPDMSSNDFHNITVSYNSGTVTAMFQQDGAQTVGNHYHDNLFTYTGSASAPAYVAHFVKGDVNFDHNTLLGDATTGKVVVEAATLFTRIENNYDENTGSTAVSVPSLLITSGNHPWTITIAKNRWAYNHTDTGNYVIHSLSNALIDFTDNTLDSTTGTGFGNIVFENTSGGRGRVRWNANTLDGFANFPVTFGAGLGYQADSSAGLCFGAATPCPGFILGSDMARESSFMIYDPDPRIFLQNSSAATDTGVYDFVTTATSLCARALNDARNVAGNIWCANGRVGNTFTDLTFTPRLVLSGGMDGVLGASTPAAATGTTIRANTGFSANGTAGASQTIVVKGSAGTDCNLVFTMGLLTSTTCP